MRVSKTYRLLAASAFAGVLACSFSDSVAFKVVPAQEFTATLSTANEVPPTTASSSGSAVFGLINDTILSYRVDVANIDSTTASHIHAGAAGVAGPVILTLFTGPACRATTGTAINIATSSVGNPTTITTAAAHALRVGSDTAVRVAGHTGSTPSLNGDYTAHISGTTTLTVPVNVTVGGTGGTVQRTVAANITSPRCRAGYSGGLTQAQIRPANLLDAGIQSYGTTPRERWDSLLSLIRSGNAYVNVHTRVFGGGEIRGQLVPR